MRINRILPYLVLVVGVLFAQENALVHALEHAPMGESRPTEQDKRALHPPLCAKCLAYAHWGTAAPSSPLALVGCFSLSHEAAVQAAVFCPALTTCFLTRGPPLLI